MPIVINGSGTVTGISVGGLPDGIVDNDTIANSTIAAGKCTFTPGKILQVISVGAIGAKLCTSTTWSEEASQTVTPVALGSKFAFNLPFQSNTYHDSANTNVYASVKLTRNVNSEGEATVFQETQGNKIYFPNSSLYVIDTPTSPTSCIDTPTYTSGETIVYKIYFSNQANAGNASIAGHRGWSIWEIGA